MTRGATQDARPVVELHCGIHESRTPHVQCPACASAAAALELEYRTEWQPSERRGVKIQPATVRRADPPAVADERVESADPTLLRNDFLALVHALARRGWKNRAIGRHIGVNARIIREWLDQEPDRDEVEALERAMASGLLPVSKGGTDRDEERFAEMVRSGMSAEEAASKLGRSVFWAGRVMRTSHPDLLRELRARSQEKREQDVRRIGEFLAAGDSFETAGAKVGRSKFWVSDIVRARPELAEFRGRRAREPRPQATAMLESGPRTSSTKPRHGDARPKRTDSTRDALEREVIKAVASKSNSEIARELGCSISTVLSILNRNNVPKEQRYGWRRMRDMKKKADARLEKIRALASAGRTTREIALEVGVTAAYLWDIAEHHGITIRSGESKRRSGGWRTSSRAKKPPEASKQIHALQDEEVTQIEGTDPNPFVRALRHIEIARALRPSGFARNMAIDDAIRALEQARRHEE